MGLIKLSSSLKLTRSQKCKAISRKRKQKQKQKRKGLEGNLGTNSNKKNSSANGGIDKLTDDLLIKILSHMSLKEAVRTSVLTHRWRFLWWFAYGTLRFDNRDTPTGNVMEMKEFES